MKKRTQQKMNIKIQIAGLILCTIFFISCTTQIENTTYVDEHNESKPIFLSYCPTMKDIALDITSKNKNIHLIETSSSAQALLDLNNNKIDIALIGRLATNAELITENKKILQEGFTLVTQQKQFIDYQQISTITIHTSLHPSSIEQLIPSSTNIIYHRTTEEAIKNGLKDAVLIDWTEFKDEYELLVVMNGTKKVKQFRLPVLYGLDFDVNELII